MRSADPKFNFEVIKLLLQSAWADLEVAQAEAQLILRQAETLDLLPEHIAKVRAYLSGAEPLPPPNMGLLRIHRQEVLELVHQLLLVDKEFSADEQEIFAEIESLLRG